MTSRFLPLAISLLAAGPLGCKRSAPAAGDDPSIARAIGCGSQHHCAVRGDGSVVCWGDNTYRQLGVETLGAAPASVVLVQGVSNAEAVSPGADFTCALLADQRVTCWGSNFYGQLGSGDRREQLEPVVVARLPPALSISAGDNAVCALVKEDDRKANTIWCWGVGHGKPYRLESSDGAVAVRLASSFVYFWDDAGQVSRAPIREASLESARKIEPVEDTFRLAGLDDLSVDSEWMSRHWLCASTESGVSCYSEMQAEENLGGRQEELVRVETLDGATQLAVGWMHACGLYPEASEVRCWGSNSAGQLGDGRTEHEILEPNPCETIYTEAGEVFTETWDCSLTSVAVENVHDPMAICSGARTSCALTEQGEVYCWGDLGVSKSPGEHPALVPLADPELIETDPVVSTCPSFGSVLEVTAVGSGGKGLQLRDRATEREFACSVTVDDDTFDCASDWNEGDPLTVYTLAENTLLCPSQFSFGIEEQRCGYDCSASE